MVIMLYGHGGAWRCARLLIRKISRVNRTVCTYMHGGFERCARMLKETRIDFSQRPLDPKVIYALGTWSGSVVHLPAQSR
eukprot:scaffold36284_cov15-Tisochrysis_lutea.AAC.1